METDTKEAVACRAGTLRVKLHRSLTGTNARLKADLEQVAIWCNQARNAMVRTWLRWHEDHPEFNQGQKHPKPWPQAVYPDGSVAPPKEKPAEGEKAKRRTQGSAEPMGFRNLLYRAGCDAAPNLAAAIVSSLAGEVQAWLITRAGLETRLKCKRPSWWKQWQALLAYDLSVPTFREWSIPVPNQQSFLAWEGWASRPNGTLTERKDGGCVLQCPLFAASYGRTHAKLLTQLDVGGLTRGHKNLIRRLVRNAVDEVEHQWKWGDSELVERKGEWYVNVSYKQPNRSLGLDQGQEAHLWLAPPDEPRGPFQVECEAGRWWVGHGQTLVAEFQRLEDRRINIRARYRDSEDRKGRGQNRFFKVFRPSERKTHEMEKRFVYNLIRDVLRFCQRNDCGSVVFHEPGTWLKGNGWFSKHNAPCDWTMLSARLKDKLGDVGITLTVVECTKAEHDRHFGLNQASAGRGTPSPGCLNGHAAKPLNRRGGKGGGARR